MDGETDSDHSSFRFRQSPSWKSHRRVTHPYTRSVYENSNVHSRGAEVVFVSVGVAAEGVSEEEWASDPTGEVGGVGFAFGYFPSGQRGKKARDFHVVHVYVNPPYRKGAARASTSATRTPA